MVCAPRVSGAGYPSRVCSILGEASTWGTAPGAGEGVDRIAEAIDQLESDLRAESGTPEVSARVAGIWLMVTALDPELARLITRYTAPGNPADGAGSLRGWESVSQAGGVDDDRGPRPGQPGRQAGHGRHAWGGVPGRGAAWARVAGQRRAPRPRCCWTGSLGEPRWGKTGAAGGAGCIRAALWRRLWIPSTGPVDNHRG